LKKFAKKLLRTNLKNGFEDTIVFSEVRSLGFQAVQGLRQRCDRLNQPIEIVFFVRTQFFNLKEDAMRLQSR
jgi:hypothetical protein